jgi:outer membrane biosynthesis protein TonB
MNHDNGTLTSGNNSDLTENDLWEILDDDEAAILSDTRVDPSVVPELLGAQQSIGVEDGDFSEFEEDAEPDQFRTKVSFASNPMARLGLASGGVLGLVLIVGAIVGGLQSSTQPPVAQVPPSPTPTPLASPMLPGTDGATKEQLAFQEQKDMMKNQKAPPPVTKKVTVPKQVTPSPSPTPTPVSTPEPIAPSPAPLPAPAPQPLPPIAVAATPPPDPNKEWSDLAQAGTYGTLPAITVASSTPQTPPPAPRPIDPIATSPPSSTLGLPSLSTYASSKKLRIGSTANATLINPIAWSSDGKDPAFANSPKFIVRLDEGLKGVDGEIVIPIGAELVVAVKSLDPKTGLADLTARSRSSSITRNMPRHPVLLRFEVKQVGP